MSNWCHVRGGKYATNGIEIHSGGPQVIFCSPERKYSSTEAFGILGEIAGPMAHACEIHDQQRRVAERFKSEALYWDAIYRGTDLYSKIYQRRREIILRTIVQLSLPWNARVLEVGSGAGLTTVELARRGHTVQAVDVVKEMLNLTLQHAAQANVSNRVSTSIGRA